MSCESGCFEFDVLGCDNVIIPTALAALTSYRVIIKRPGSNIIFDREVMADAEGRLALTGYPLGLFNRGEIFQMRVESESGLDVLLSFDGKIYSCVQFKVMQSV